MTLAERHTKALHKKARRGFQGYPVATVAYYGPDARKATKVAVAVVSAEGAEPDALERWFNDARDIRRDHQVNQQILQFLSRYGVRSVVMSDGIVGCPHEEGIDYPEGEACPQCPYWAGRDRGLGAAGNGAAQPANEAERARPAGPAAQPGPGAPRDRGQQLCPCGSGRTFAECCGAAPSAGGSSGTSEVMREIQQQLEDREFADEAELQAFADDLMARRNRRGLDDFDGLSPSQMEALLYHPFESPPLDNLEGRLRSDIDAPILALFRIIADAARERGIKLTARGNLPLKLVKHGDAWLQADGGLPDEIHRRVSTERDVRPFHHVRLIAELAGLLRKSRGYLYLTRRAEKMLDKDDRAALYARLFQAFARRFNWAYGDGFDELLSAQHGFGFTLYLLHRHGGEWRPATFYEDGFLRAFPMALDNAEEGMTGLDPERRTRLAWSLRTFHGFGYLCGLVELASEAGPPPRMPDSGLLVRATPLLADVFPHPPPS